MHFQESASRGSEAGALPHGIDLGRDHRPAAGLSDVSAMAGFELSGENGLQLYIPKGFAHGFQTLADDTRVNYLISEFYAPAAACGVRYNDPAFDVRWPLPVTMIAEKDLQWPDFAG